MNKKTARMALCGVLCGAGVLIIMSTALFTGLSYAIPMIAGALLLIPAIEFGSGTAAVAYAATGLLAVILPADKESALMYIFLFGFYPIIKKFFEMIKLRAVEYLLKLLYFNASGAAALLLASYVTGLPVNDGTLGKWFYPVLLILGNICFFIYDRALTLAVTLYLSRLQPLLRKTFHIK